MFWSQPNPCTKTTVRPEVRPVTRMLFLRWMLIHPCSHAVRRSRRRASGAVVVRRGARGRGAGPRLQRAQYGHHVLVPVAAGHGLVEEGVADVEERGGQSRPAGGLCDQAVV